MRGLNVVPSAMLGCRLPCGEQAGDHAGQDAVDEVVGAFGSGCEVLHGGGQVGVLACDYDCAEKLGLPLRQAVVFSPTASLVRTKSPTRPLIIATTSILTRAETGTSRA